MQVVRAEVGGQMVRRKEGERVGNRKEVKGPEGERVRR